MSVMEVTYRPTSSSVARKNTKWELASALLFVWEAVQDCKDEETKRKIIERLLSVL